MTSELLTMAVIGHFEQTLSYKKLYRRLQSKDFEGYFHKLPSYEQFVRNISALESYMDEIIRLFVIISQALNDRVFIIDSTALPMSKHAFKHIKWHGNTASLSKSMDVWYQGFKLYLVINSHKQIVNFCITTASINDSQLLDPKVLLSNISGLLIGDKGYIAKA